MSFERHVFLKISELFVGEVTDLQEISQTCPENCFENNIDKSAERMVGPAHPTLCRVWHGSSFFTSLSSTLQHWFLIYIQMYRSQRILYPFRFFNLKFII